MFLEASDWTGEGAKKTVLPSGRTREASNVTIVPSGMTPAASDWTADAFFRTVLRRGTQHVVDFSGVQGEKTGRPCAGA